MGYELNKLMAEYGVSTPGVAPYSGPAKPIAPVEPIMPGKAESTGGGMLSLMERKAREAVDKADYDRRMKEYRAHQADPSSFNEMMRKYDLAMGEYNNYRDQFRNRIANTPMYTDAQFRTNTPLDQQPVSNREPLRAPTYGVLPRDVMTAGQQERGDLYNDMRNVGYSDKDIYDSAMNYGGVQGVNDMASAAAVYGVNSSLPDLAWGVGWNNSPPKPTVDYMSHGGMHDLAQRYQVGGVVRRFATGGDEGVPEDEILQVLKERSPDMGGRMPPAVDGRFPEQRGEPAAPMQQSRVTEGEGTQYINVPPRVQQIDAPAPSTTPISPAATDLMSMLERYSTESPYAAELKAARKRATAESAAFADMIGKAMAGENTKPDKAEMYFRLAAAFGAPTKTGHFSENLGMAGKELAEYAKDVRTANKADRQLRMQLALEAQKLKSQTAREDLLSLRALASEDMKDKRAVLLEYIKSGRPQSEAGKAAIDAGLKQGTPEFQEFVNKYIDDKIRSGNLFKEAMVAISGGNLQVAQSREKRAAESASKLTPKEVDLKAQAEVNIGGIEDSMASLKRAYALNPNTFDGTLAATAQRKILEQTDPKDKRVLATREQQNLLSKGAIDKLRASFGGNPTEGERAALLGLEGIDSKSKEERALIMKNTYKLLKERLKREEKRLQEIQRGSYRETTPSIEGDE